MRKSKLKIIQEIQSSVPQAWRDKLMTEQYIAPDLRDEAIKTLAEYPDDIAKLEGDEQKSAEKDFSRLQNLYEAGYYDATEQVVDEKIGKKIENYIEKALKEAMKSGKLPKAKNDKELANYIKKLHKHETKQRKSSVRSK